MTSLRHQKRDQKRQARKALSPSYRRKGTQRINAQLCYQLRHARRAALYLHFDGEPDVLPTIAALLRKKRAIYLPVIRKSSMSFVSINALRKARINRYGIIEPNHRAERISSKRLQAIVLPLTAYDEQGNRMGMGAGFYDRTLAWKKNKPKLGATLIGCAWRCQQTEQLGKQTWDIPLNKLVNEATTLTFRNCE